MDKPTSKDTHSEDHEPIPEDPESLRNLLPGNIPFVVVVALVVLLVVLGLLMALGS